MKFLFALAVALPTLYGQSNPVPKPTIQVTSDPTGPCSNFNAVNELNIAATPPRLWTCTGGVWVLTSATGGGGSVMSVGITPPSWLTASAPVTSSGVITLTPTTGQTTHQVIGTCGSGTTFVPCSPSTADLSDGSNVVKNNQANTYTGGALQDFHSMKFKPATATVSTLPSAASSTNLVYLVTDGTSAIDCSAGSGSTLVWCASTGSVWQPLASSASAGVSTFIGRAGTVVANTGDYTAAQVTNAVSLAAANTYSGGGLQDFHAMKFLPPTSTISGLPAAAGGNTGQIYEVTDGASASDCVTGSGSTRVWCVSTGSAWVPIGGSGGGVSSISTTAPITGGPITTTGTIACGTCGVTGSPLSQFAATTSAQLAGVLSDETGTGVAVFGTNPSINFGSSTTFVLPSAAAATSSKNLTIDTNKNIHGWANAADSILAVIPSAPTTGNCAQWAVSSSNVTLTDFGSPCNSGGGSANIAALDCSLTRTDATHLSIFNGASSTNYCSVQNNGVATKYTAAGTVTQSGSLQPTVRIYVSDGSDGQTAGSIVVLNSISSAIAVSGSGVVLVNSTSAFPISCGIYIIGTWASSVAGSFDATGTVQRPLLNSGCNLIQGTGITITPASGGTTIGLTATAVTPGSYTNVNATVDAYGRITSMANGSASVNTPAVARFGVSCERGGASMNGWSEFSTNPAVPICLNSVAAYTGGYMQFSNANTNIAVVDGIPVPPWWTSGTVTVRFRVFGDNSGSGNLQLQAATYCVNSGTTYGASQTYNSANTTNTVTTATANLVYILTATLTMTGCSANDMLTIKVSQTGANTWTQNTDIMNSSVTFN